MVLHTLNKPPHSSHCLASCLRVIGANDSLILIEDGVYAAIKGDDGLPNLAEGIAVYALQADIEARGLTHRLDARVRVVDEEGFVDLTLSHAKVQSWY